MLVHRRFWLRSCLTLLLLLVGSSAPSVLAQGATTAFSGTAAKQQVDALAVQIGSRPAGSAAYDQAVRYATDQLRQWGYQPSLQSFPVQTYDDRGSQVEVTGPIASTSYVGLDWFCLNLFVLALLFVPLELAFARRTEQGVFRRGWLTDLCHFGVSHLAVNRPFAYQHTRR